jgi:hypothetical protein
VLLPRPKDELLEVEQREVDQTADHAPLAHARRVQYRRKLRVSVAHPAQKRNAIFFKKKGRKEEERDGKVRVREDRMRGVCASFEKEGKKKKKGKAHRARWSARKSASR